MIMALFLAMLTLLGRLVLVQFQSSLRINQLGLLGLSYLVGIGVFTWVLYLFMVLGGHATLSSTLILAVVLIVVGLYLSLRHLSTPLALWRTRWTAQSTADLLTITPLIPIFVLSFYVSYWTPIYWSDSVYYYDGVGKILAVDGSIYSDALKRPLCWCNGIFVHGQPSLLVHSLHAVAYLLKDEHVAVLYSGFFASLVLVFGFVRWEPEDEEEHPITQRLLASAPWRLILLAFATVPFVFAMGYVAVSSLPGAVYFFAAILVWKRFMERPSRQLAVLSGALFAMCSWTRGEAIYFYLPVLLLTLAIATIRPNIRSHIVAFLIPLLLLDVSRYAFIFTSGQFLEYARDVPLPHVDFLALLAVVAGAVLVTRVGARQQEWLATAMVAAGVLVLVAVIALIALNFKGVSDSATQLFRLLRDPVWGLTGIVVATALVSPSLFRNTERLIFMIIIAFVAVRVLLYAHIVNLNLSDNTITSDGNRVLLYMWPVAIYWLSCSKELHSLFASLSKLPFRIPSRVSG